MRKLLPLILLVPFSLCGCQKKGQEKQEEPSEHVEPHYNEVENLHINWSDLFRQSEDTYYAYVYFVTCTPCSYLREKVVGVAQSGKTHLYFVMPSDDVPFTSDLDLAMSSLGKKDVKDVYIYSTPTLIEITDKAISLYTREYSEIDNFLNSFGD